MFKDKTIQEQLKKADETSRRHVVKGLAAGLLALNYTDALQGARRTPPGVKNAAGGKAKSVIFIMAAGGLSQVDSFDIKEANKDANWNSSPIKSSAKGIRVGKHFPKMAQQMHHFAAINSMHHTQGVHSHGSYLMRTGYAKRGTVSHPELGAWTLKLGQRRSGDLPPFIKIGKHGRGSGFFDSSCAALPVSNPEEGLANTHLPKGISDRRFEHRYSLMEKLNREYERQVDHTSVDDYQYAYQEAVKVMKSPDLEVFDLSKESDKTKAAYGKTRFGMSCLLARRLVEKGVSFINLHHGGWDHHHHIYKEFGGNAVDLDQGVGALVADLAQRGLLDSTIVAFSTEFGRGSKLGPDAGRGHNPQGFTCMLAGGGIQGGQQYGATDPMGGKAMKNKVSVGDYHATIATAMGLPIDHVEMSPQGRPFQIGNKGAKPLTSLF